MQQPQQLGRQTLHCNIAKHREALFRDVLKSRFLPYDYQCFLRWLELPLLLHHCHLARPCHLSRPINFLVPIHPTLSKRHGPPSTCRVGLAVRRGCPTLAVLEIPATLHNDTPVVQTSRHAAYRRPSPRYPACLRSTLHGQDCK